MAIAGEVANPVYSLIVQPEIKSYADLKGKTIGLSLPVDTISISMRKLFAHEWPARRRLCGEGAGRHTGALECLKKGECSAVPLGQPQDFAAMKEGYRRLGLSTEAVTAFQFQVTAARRSWAADNKDAVGRFVRGLGAAFRFIRDPATAHDVVRTSSRRPARGGQCPSVDVTLF